LSFSFQDLVLLRAAKGLVDEAIPTPRVRRALSRLRERLPVGRPLSALRIAVLDHTIVVRDGGCAFEPESGQVRFDFHTAPIGEAVASIVRKQPAPAPERDAQAWFAWACEIELSDPSAALEAYERAVSLEPKHADALLNLGRMHHERGALGEAHRLYRRALKVRPEDAVAAFNLGVALEDLDDPRQAMRCYRRALKHDPSCADAHYNLARLYERGGEHTRALRHLGAYRRLMRPQ
jgi:tetratricopeptide (TPR) repeat protein